MDPEELLLLELEELLEHEPLCGKLVEKEKQGIYVKLSALNVLSCSFCGILRSVHITSLHKQNKRKKTPSIH